MRRIVVTGAAIADSTRSSPAIRRRTLSFEKFAGGRRRRSVHRSRAFGSGGVRGEIEESAERRDSGNAVCDCVVQLHEEARYVRPEGRGETTSATKVGCGPTDGDAASRRHEAAASRLRGRRPGRPRRVRRCRPRERRPTVASPTRIGASTGVDGSGEGGAPVARCALGRPRSENGRPRRPGFSPSRMASAPMSWGQPSSSGQISMRSDAVNRSIDGTASSSAGIDGASALSLARPHSHLTLLFAQRPRSSMSWARVGR